MFEQKRVIITGGSSGVGKVLAERLISKKANLALIARDKQKLSDTKKEFLKIASPGQTVEVFSCDVSDNQQVDETIKKIADKMGTPDILINSAGILREGYFENQPLDTFRNVMDINFFGTLHCIQSVLPFFKTNGKGRIINICSMAGLIGVFGYSAYCASKHAIAGLTGSLRAELKYQNIACHIVYPPEFDSPMVDEINKNRTAENRIIAQTIPLLSAGTVADEIIKGVEKGRYEITPGIATRIIARFDKLFPAAGRAVSDFKISRIYKGP